jgi:hypothetical protein
MKKMKKIELDVDFIGGESPLTLAEEKALSDFFKQRKKLPKRRAIQQAAPQEALELQS